VLFITDPAFGDGPTVRCVRTVAASLPRGAFAVQIRDKVRALTSLRAFAWELRVVTRACGARLLVNGNAAVARDVDADGVHLGHGAGSVAEVRRVLGRACWVSRAAHSDQDVRLALAERADAVLVSPVFATRSLDRSGGAKTPRGLDCIHAARQCAGKNMLIYALGGVSSASARACGAAGADGAAVIRALQDAADPGREARAIHDGWASCW
jgi:thiamine-phosphate pyrophosphorylase